MYILYIHICVVLYKCLQVGSALHPYCIFHGLDSLPMFHKLSARSPCYKTTKQVRKNHGAVSQCQILKVESSNMKDFTDQNWEFFLVIKPMVLALTYSFICKS